MKKMYYVFLQSNNSGQMIMKDYSRTLNMFYYSYGSIINFQGHLTAS